MWPSGMLLQIAKYTLQSYNPFLTGYCRKLHQEGALNKHKCQVMAEIHILNAKI